MAIDYTNAAATAKRLIEQNGRDTIFHRLSRVKDDGALPWRGTTTVRTTYDRSVTGKAVFVPPSSARDLGFTLTNEQLIAGVTQILIVAATSFPADDLSTFDEIEDGAKYKIERVDVLKPADISILYFIQVVRVG